MKTKLLTLVTLVVAIAPFAPAQEATPTPDAQLGLRGAEPSLRSEPSVSVPTETPLPEYPRPGTPVVTPKPKAEPQKAASPSPTPTPSVTRDAKAAKSRAASSPAARSTTKTEPQAGSSPAAKKKDLPATVREMENEWAAATAKHDIATVQALLASDYVGVTAGGNVVNKAGLIAELKKDKNTYESVTNSGLEVRPHGDATVVVGTTKQKGKDAAGKPFSYTYRWTDTWVKRDGQWQCVASQSIRWRE